MTRRLVVTPEAKAQLNSLYEYLAREASLEIATRYIDAVMARIAGLTDFPHRANSKFGDSALIVTSGAAKGVEARRPAPERVISALSP